LTALVWLSAPTPVAAQSGAIPSRLLQDVATLADDRWEGRQTCTPGNDSAAVFVARRFAQLQLTAHAFGQNDRNGDAPNTGYDRYFHRYTARPNPHVAPPGLSTCATQNVAAIVSGTDPGLADEVVIIGAHYDHLGRNPANALDPGAGDAIRNGADDNASGTAAVLELARLFKSRPAKRSLLFVTFSGEEWGVLGSQEFARHALLPGRVQAMVNFDMIGRLRDDKLLVFGTGTAPQLPAIVDSANTGAPLRISKVADGNGPSDHSSFYQASIPVLHLFTDTHSDYHRATDDVDRINAPGMARVVDYAERVIRLLADRRDSLTFTRTATAPAIAAPSSGARPYLGSVPDMAAADVPGLRINDVTPGSPGDKGGLKAGDVVVEFAGLAVTDLTTYSQALNSRKPGDTVTIVVLRGSTRVSLTVTLGTRGG
jgi:hypothetical protein